MSGINFLLKRNQYNLQQKKVIYEGLLREKVDTCRLKAFGILLMVWLEFFVKPELELKDKS